MAVVASWNSCTFQISESDAAMINNIKLRGECEIEEKTENGQTIVEMKNRKPAQITMTAVLHASFGVDVREWATRLVEEAQKGGSDYFYMGGKKVFPFKLMLTNAETEEVLTSPSGAWIRTNVNMTLKQCSVNENVPEPTPPASAGDSGGHTAPKKKSVKTSPPSKAAAAPGKNPPKSDYTFMVDAPGKVIIPGKPRPPVKHVTQTVSKAKSVKSGVGEK